MRMGAASIALMLLATVARADPEAAQWHRQARTATARGQQREVARDPAITPSVPPPAPVPVPQASAPPPALADHGPRPGVALALSLGTTVGGVALVTISSLVHASSVGRNLANGLAITGAVAIFFGPTAGHLYAGHRPTWWLAGRALSAVGFVAGVDLSLCGPEFGGSGCTGDTPAAAGGVLALVSAVAFLVTTIAEIATAPRDARAHHVTVELAPTVTAHGGGLAIAGSF